MRASRVTGSEADSTHIVETSSAPLAAGDLVPLAQADLDLTWSASGLPGGLTINPASGLISGTIGFGAGNPDPGVFEVLITVNAVNLIYQF